jgi:hypothetical protein
MLRPNHQRASIIPFFLQHPASAWCELPHARVSPGRSRLEVMRFGSGLNQCWHALGWASAVLTLAGMASFALVATAIDLLRPIVL